MRSPAPPVFGRLFDVIVCGSGTIGFAAARSLAAGGLDVLLIDASGDLLWESSLALENRIGNADGGTAWSDWIQRLDSLQGVRSGFFDGALTETLAASELEKTKNLSALLYAMPVAIETEDSLINAVIVATKSGPRRLQARKWVDASERGLLVQSCLPEADNVRREPATHYRSVVLQSTAWESSDPVPVAGAEWFTSVRKTERRLRWPAPAGVAWHDDVLAAIRRLRSKITVPFLVSHASRRDFPIYEAAPTASAIPALPANLLVLSPAFSTHSPDSIQERFLLGASAPARVAKLSAGGKVTSAKIDLPQPAGSWSTEVLVAGTGTAGALAALSAAGHGANTLAIDFAAFPGGIGTEGGINKYCEGLPGGLQSHLDELTAEYSRLLVGGGTFGAHWHHLGKRLAILTLFAEAGVRFQGEALLCGLEKSTGGRVEAVLVAVDGRIRRTRANAFVDSTGDGDLCALAGADFVIGRPEDGVCLAFSQVGFALRKGAEAVVARNYDAGWVDPTDPEDLSRARLRGLAQYLRPAWTDEGRPFAFAGALGLRQSRQVRTDLAVTFHDLIDGATFPDSIGGALTFADTHAVDFEFETDESLFYYWVCQAFREHLRCELPYRMLLPVGLTNVWIACRASGIDGAAAYGIRMQRDMQRLGEAAGTAAALVAGASGESRSVSLPRLQELLRTSGACAVSAPPSKSAPDELHALLQNGKAGFHLWQIHRQPALFGETVEGLLSSPDPAVSFNAAAVLAMWKSAKAEARLISALREREQGPPPTCGKGAFAQEVDIPHWLIAVVLLRRCGTARCLPLLQELAAEKAQPLNVRTCIALTLERLGRAEDAAQVFKIQESLLHQVADVANLPPTRSVRRMLDGKTQLVLGNYTGADTREDQSWQLHLVIARTRARLGLPLQSEANGYRQDRRSYVRRAFGLQLGAV